MSSNRSKKYKIFAFHHQNGHCYYCGFPMWLENPEQFSREQGLSIGDCSRLKCTAEHLVARQDGGRNSEKNIVAACRHCNQTRHKVTKPLSPPLYRQRVIHRVQSGRWHCKHLYRLIAPVT